MKNSNENIFYENDEENLIPLNYILQCPIQQREKIVKGFVNAGYNIDAINGNGYSTIQIACFESDTNAVRLLIESGSKGNYEMDSNSTIKNILNGIINIWKEIDPSKHSGKIRSLENIRARLHSANNLTNYTEIKPESEKSNWNFIKDHINFNVTFSIFLLSLSIYLFLETRNSYGKLIKTLLVIFIIIVF